MGRYAVDPVRRLTLALLLATVAALGMSNDEALDEGERVVKAPVALPAASPWRLAPATVFDHRRCTERAPLDARWLAAGIDAGALNPYRQRPR